MVHELKTWVEYFELVENGTKSFELRKNDRNFLPGHDLLLREYDKNTEEYTGRTLKRKITYVLKGPGSEFFGLKKGYCIMSLEKN